MDNKLLVIVGVIIFILWLYHRSNTLKSLGITVSKGRGRCYVCNKQLDGRIHNVGNNRYFCRRHAIKASKGLIKINGEGRKHPSGYYTSTQELDDGASTYKAPELSKRKPFKGSCEYCKKKVEYIFDRFYCPYCEKWHCPKHRIPHNHECEGSPKSLPVYLREIWSRRGRIVTIK